MRVGKGKREDKWADAPREGMGEEREEDAIGEEEAKGRGAERKEGGEEKGKIRCGRKPQRMKSATGRGRCMPR